MIEGGMRMDIARIVFDAEQEEARRMGYDPYYDKPSADPSVNDPYHRREMPDKDGDRVRPMRQDDSRNRRGMEYDRYNRGRGMYAGGGEKKIGFDRGGSSQRAKAAGKKLTMDEAEEWVDAMENESDEYPTGGRWDVDEVAEIAEEYGIKPEETNPKFIEFYAVMNMMFSDYGEIIEKFDLDEEDFCACMAMAWIKDRDAERGKTKRYYDCIVKK